MLLDSIIALERATTVRGLGATWCQFGLVGTWEGYYTLVNTLACYCSGSGRVYRKYATSCQQFCVGLLVCLRGALFPRISAFVAAETGGAVVLNGIVARVSCHLSLLLSRISSLGEDACGSISLVVGINGVIFMCGDAGHA